MMVVSEAVTGVSESEIDVGSPQDLAKVGDASGRTQVDAVDGDGDGDDNVPNDLDGAYVFVFDSGELTADDPISDQNCITESKLILESNVNNAEEVQLVNSTNSDVGEVQFGELVVKNGGNDQSSVVGGSQCVLSVKDEEVGLHGESGGEILEVGTTSEEERPHGIAVEDYKSGQNDCEVKDDKGSSPVPEENHESLNLVKTETDAGFGEGQESVNKPPEAGELSDRSLNSVEPKNIGSSVDLGEGKNNPVVIQVSSGCELLEVEVDVGKSMDQMGVESDKEIGESLESQIRITGSVDSVSHEVCKKEGKLEKMTELDIDVDDGCGAVELAIGTDAPAEEGISCLPIVDNDKISIDKELCECLDGGQRDTELGVTFSNSANLPSPDAYLNENEVGEVAAEWGGNTTASGNDGEIVEQAIDTSENPRSVLLHRNEVPHLANEANTDTKTTCNPDRDENEALPSEEHIDCNGASQKNSDIDENKALLSEEHIECNGASQKAAPSPDAGTLTDQGLRFADDVGCGIVQGHEAEMVIQNSDGLLTNANGFLSDKTQIPQTDDMSECIDNSPESPEMNNPEKVSLGCIIQVVETGELQIESDGSFHSGSSTDTITDQEAGNVFSSVIENSVTSETDNTNVELENKSHDSKEAESVLLCAANGTKSETEADNGQSNCSSNYVSSGTNIVFGSIQPEVTNSNSQCADVAVNSQVSDEDIECVYNKTIFNNFDPDNHVVDTLQTGNYADKSATDFQNPTTISISDMPGKDATINGPEVLGGSIVIGGGGISPVPAVGDKSDKPIYQDSKQTSGIPVDQLSASLPEDSNCIDMEKHNRGVQAVTKPFQFLVRVPRYDEKIGEQMRYAKQLVEEKTVQRDVIRSEIQKRRNNFQALSDTFEAAKSEERAARRSVKLKRQEIDSVQAVINRVKNAISVGDINNRIQHMEYMIEHETQPLKEEKLLIREIKQLKQLRDEIASNMGSKDEIGQALNQKDHFEERVKILKKELGGLKEKVAKAEVSALVLGKKYDDESNKLRELQAHYRAANDVRQEAYKQFSDLKRQLHDKSKYYWTYRDEVKEASEYASRGDLEALHRLCINQVETLMELWNKNDEFRNEYVRCNMRSTLRRLKTFDGRSLGPGEEAPLLPNYVDEHVNGHLFGPPTTTSSSLVSLLEQGNPVQLVKGKILEAKPLEVAEPKNQILENKTRVKSIQGRGSEAASHNLEDERTKAEDNLQTNRELELVMKADNLKMEELGFVRKAENLQAEVELELARKAEEEIAAKLKEQRRLEEKAKAQEALERKKRNSEKAQIRAELRAQKEAEQKEKEREKRLRKKERKTTDGDIAPAVTEITKEESVESPTTAKPKKTLLHIKQSKPKATIPPALRNKGKRRLRQFMWWVFGALMVLFIFLVGNGGAFGSLRARRDDKMFGSRRSSLIY